MIELILLVVGTVVGFVASRALRKPQNSAAAASAVRNVSGSLGRRKGLTPPELQRACFSEMVRHVQVDATGHTRAPAKYALRMHPDDVAIVTESRGWFTDGLVKALRDAAKDHGWVIAPDVDISYEADPSRRPGVPTAVAVTSAEAPKGTDAVPSKKRPRSRPATSDAPVAAPALALVRSDTAATIPLHGATVTVGRSQDRDVVVNDDRVSRVHLRFERRGRVWVVLDEGSANGTLLRNRRLSPHEPAAIRPGDVVSVGPVDLKVVATEGSRPQRPGTRALDDSDRHRLSRDFLPPVDRR